MKQYILKSTLVAEIERRIKKIPKDETNERFKAIYGERSILFF